MPSNALEYNRYVERMDLMCSICMRRVSQPYHLEPPLPQYNIISLKAHLEQDHTIQEVIDELARSHWERMMK